MEIELGIFPEDFLKRKQRLEFFQGPFPKGNNTWNYSKDLFQKETTLGIFPRTFSKRKQRLELFQGPFPKENNVWNYSRDLF